VRLELSVEALDQLRPDFAGAGARDLRRT
jgi:hypothetical protein